MEVRCITTGRVREKAGVRGVRRYLADDWRTTTLPVHCFAVAHERGWCLFDTGQTPLAATAGYFPGWQPFFRLSRFELGADESAVSQLKQAGVSPADVRWVVLSHLHTDHAGGVADFPAAQIVVARAEWSRAQGIPGRIRGYLPDRWPPAVTPTLIDLTGPALGPFAATHDVAGDGRLLVVPTPGHTPAHVALLVRDSAGDLLLGGDICHTGEELERRSPAVAAWCREAGVTFVVSHDDGASALLAARVRSLPR